MKILVLHSIFIEPATAFSKKTNYPIFTNTTYKPTLSDILIVFGAHNAATQLIQLKNTYKINYIIMQSEQLNSACFHMPHYIDLLKMSLVFDWSYHNIHLLNKNYNIKCHSIFSWSFLTPNLMSLSMNAEKNFDIFFAGVKTIERIAIIDKLKKLNPTLKWFVDLEYRLTDYIKLSKILSRCKYVINIPAYKESALETHRIVKGLYSNCQILRSVLNNGFS